VVRHEPHHLARERCGSFVTASYRPTFGSGSSGLGLMLGTDNTRYARIRAMHPAAKARTIT